jgi:hypothetical protein
MNGCDAASASAAATPQLDAATVLLVVGADLEPVTYDDGHRAVRESSLPPAIRSRLDCAQGHTLSPIQASTCARRAACDAHSALFMVAQLRFDNVSTRIVALLTA